jgi:Tfp pilus assembly protein PilV
MNKITKKNQTGLTLPETMIALTAGIIVFLATASVLVLGQKSWNREWSQANLQKEAAHAMLKMKQSIRNGNKAELEGDGTGVKIFYTGGWIRFYSVSTQKDLRYQLDGEDEKTLLDGVVDSATFEVDPDTQKTVKVGIQLQNGNCTAGLVTTTMMRNYTQNP